MCGVYVCGRVGMSLMQDAIVLFACSPICIACMLISMRLPPHGAYCCTAAHCIPSQSVVAPCMHGDDVDRRASPMAGACMHHQSCLPQATMYRILMHAAPRMQGVLRDAEAQRKAAAAATVATEGAALGSSPAAAAGPVADARGARVCALCGWQPSKEPHTPATAAAASGSSSSSSRGSGRGPRPAAKLRCCARCCAVRYCCDACQRAHWLAGHKAVCKKPATTPAAGAAQ
jgi:hypothetical protein